MSVTFITRAEAEARRKHFIVKYDIEGDEFVAFETAVDIFSRMDLDDCYDIQILDIRIAEPNEFLTECEFRGTWHDMDDPLKMGIYRKADGSCVVYSWGTDH